MTHSSSQALLIAAAALAVTAPAAASDLWSYPSQTFSSSVLADGWWDSDASGTGLGYHIAFARAGPGSSKIAPVHGAVLPYLDVGRLVIWSGAGDGIGSYFLDRASPESVLVETLSISNQEYFCAGHTLLPSTGDLLILGGNYGIFSASGPPGEPTRWQPGDAWSSLLDASDNSVNAFKNLAPMPGRERFYPTALIQPDGAVLALGGEYWVDLDGDSLFNDPGEKFDNDPWIEHHSGAGDPQHGVWCEVENRAETAGYDIRRLQLYPYMQRLPEGLFYLGPFWKSGQPMPQADSASFYWPDTGGYERDSRYLLSRGACSQVVLALDAADPVSRVMVIGGGNESDGVTNAVEIWDSSLPYKLQYAPTDPDSSRWIQADSMAFQRNDLDAVLLPNGHVFVVGGHQTDHDDFVYDCETFVPGAGYGTWQLSDAIGRHREYHSVTLLLPDGRVFAAGGENRFPPPGDPDDPATYEIYYPPYLFVSDGAGGYRVRDQSGDRPVITSISEHGPSGSRKIYYDAAFTIGVSDIDLDQSFAVALMRPCSVTHSNDMNQRLIYAEATKLSAGVITVVGSSLNAGLAPPGAYMVFVLDQSQVADGIPSEAGWIFLEEGVPPGGNLRTWSGLISMTADSLVAVGDTLVIANGTTINVSTTDGNDLEGVDTGRIELIVRGTLLLNGTTASPITFQKTPIGPQKASWYGIRVTEAGEVVFQGQSDAVAIKNARSAVAWERRAAPDFSDIDGHVVFTFDTDYITFDRDVVVAADSMRAIPAGWSVGFEDGDQGACGADSSRVELVIMGQCDIGASSGGTTTLRPAKDAASWYGVRFLDSSDVTAVSDLVNVTFSGTVFTVTTDSLSGSITGCTFGDADSADVLIPHDTRIPSGRTWSFTDGGLDDSVTVLVAAPDPRPEPRAGLDSAAVEVVFEGALDADNGIKVTFTSKAASPAAGDWYGIRVGGAFASTIASNAADLDIQYACAPFILEAFDLDELQAYFDSSGTYATVSSCLMEVGLGTDWVPDGTTASTIPDNWTIGMAPRYDRGEGGADTSRVEIDATQVAFNFGEGTTLRSIRKTPGPGDWLGVRTTDTDFSNSVAGSGTPRFVFPGGATDKVTIRDAGGAFALEGDLGTSGWPDFGLMDSVVAFQNNRSHFSVDRDQVIAGQDTIPSGWTMGFANHRDASPASLSASSSLIELIIHGGGSLTASASDSIGFVSDAAKPSPNDWYGLRLDLIGVEMTGYGYLACLDGSTPVDCHSTVLKGVTIADAQYGVAIDSLRAATVDSVTFRNIKNDRHIYLNNTDVVISRQLWWLGSEVDYWNLLPGTNVVASQTATDKLSYGESGKADLAVWGKMFAVGDTSNPVVFRSDSLSTATGDDWGGIILSSEAAGSLIKYADIGFADVPVFLSYPDTLTAVSHSLIHHFNDTGIWVEGAKYRGGVIKDNVIQRDDPTVNTIAENLEAEYGSVGIFLDRADEMSVLDNIVNLDGLDTTSGGTGIDVYWGSSFCQSLPVGSNSLLIQGNFVGGPGNTEPSELADYSGIRLGWVCGEQDRSIDILENYIEEWRYSGLEFAQSEDIQVSCNYVGEVLGGLSVYLTKTAGPMIRVKDNSLDALESSDNDFAAATNDTAAVGLGPVGSNVKGTNRLTVSDSQTWFVDHDSSGTFQAQDNYWYLKDSSTGAIAQVTSQQSDITNRIDGAAAIDNWDTTDPGDQDCPPARPSGAPAARAASGPVTAQAGDRSRVQTAAPREISLGLPFPNPSRRGFEVSLAVPPDHLGWYAMEVFDVTGRRVLRSDQRFTVPGRFSVVWGGRDQSGRRVASGIYFMRLSAPGFRKVRKVTLVR